MCNKTINAIAAMCALTLAVGYANHADAGERYPGLGGFLPSYSGHSPVENSSSGVSTITSGGQPSLLGGLMIATQTVAPNGQVTTTALGFFGVSTAPTYQPLALVDSTHRYAGVPASWQKTVNGKKVVVTPCGAVHVDYLDGVSVQAPCDANRIVRFGDREFYADQLIFNDAGKPIAKKPGVS